VPSNIIQRAQKNKDLKKHRSRADPQHGTYTTFEVPAGATEAAVLMRALPVSPPVALAASVTAVGEALLVGTPLLCAIDAGSKEPGDSAANAIRFKGSDSGTVIRALLLPVDATDAAVPTRPAGDNIDTISELSSTTIAMVAFSAM